MKIKKPFLCLLAVLLGGCVPSLHPLYTEKEIVFEEKLLGVWTQSEPNWLAYDFPSFRTGNGKNFTPFPSCQISGCIFIIPVYQDQMVLIIDAVPFLKQLKTLVLLFH